MYRRELEDVTGLGATGAGLLFAQVAGRTRHRPGIPVAGTIAALACPRPGLADGSIVREPGEWKPVEEEEVSQ